jgi:hypothetical protein
MLDWIVQAELTLGPLFLLLAGVALLLWGRRLFWAMVALAGFMVGWMYGGQLAAELTESPQVIRWAPLVLGVVLAVVSGLLLKVSIFLGGLVIGWFLCAELAPGSALLARAAAALISGGLLLGFRRVIIAVLTSMAGARMAVLGAISLLAWVSVGVGSTVVFLATAALAVAGVVHQLRRRRRS